MYLEQYYDNDSILQVIGCVFLKPSLLSQTGQYFLTSQDFLKPLHRIVYGAASQIYQQGAVDVTPQAVDSYLGNGFHPESYAIFQANNGVEWITNAANFASLDNFEFNYNRVKKMTIIRNFINIGFDMKWLYDPDNLIDMHTKEKQKEHLDEISIQELIDEIDSRIELAKIDSMDSSVNEIKSLGEDIDTLLDNLQNTPAVGQPFSYGTEDNGYSGILNRLTMGARKGKVYIRSAASGVGKSRTLMSDACMLGCKHIWDNGEWIDLTVNGDEPNTEREGVLFISTELQEDELQTLALAFISGVNEEKILGGLPIDFEEKQRITRAAEELKNSSLKFIYLPNFRVSDIENIVKRAHFGQKCNYIFYDYLGTSLGILEDISSRAKGIAMREDSILFILATRLKELAIQYDIFIETATQLNQGWKTDSIPDQNLLRGAKSIADRIDIGTILLNVTQDDLENLSTAGYIDKWGRVPNVKLSVYKNRRGRIVNCYIWMYADKGTCRFDPIAATTWDLAPYEIASLSLVGSCKQIQPKPVIANELR